MSYLTSRQKSLRLFQQQQAQPPPFKVITEQKKENRSDTQSVVSNIVINLGDNPFNSEHFSKCEISSEADADLSQSKYEVKNTESETLQHKCRGLQPNKPHCNSKNGVCRSSAHSHYNKAKSQEIFQVQGQHSKVIQQVLLRQSDSKAIMRSCVEEQEYIIQIKTSQYITKEQIEYLKKLGTVTILPTNKEDCSSQKQLKTQATPLKFEEDINKLIKQRQMENSKDKIIQKKVQTTLNNDSFSPKTQIRKITNPNPVSPMFSNTQNIGISSFKRQNLPSYNKGFDKK